MQNRTDLWIAALIMICSSSVAAAAFYRAGAGLSRRTHAFITLCLSLLIITFEVWFSDAPLLACIFPVSALPVYGKLSFPLAFLLGAMLMRAAIPLWRRILFLSALLAIACYSLLAPLYRITPSCENYWQEGICIQTQQASCAAAASATLLKLHGIVSSEQEMAGLCLTDYEGTFASGVYRGLLLKTGNSPYHPEMYATTVDELRTSGKLPAIVSVRLTPSTDRKEPRYSRDWGWLPGVRHSVVVLSFTNDDRVVIGDPSFGRETWELRALRDLWVGDSTYLANRNASK